jgi:hypothetical protein
VTSRILNFNKIGETNYWMLGKFPLMDYMNLASLPILLVTKYQTTRCRNPSKHSMDGTRHMIALTCSEMKDSSVGIAMGCTARVRFPAMQDSLYPTAFRLVLGPTHTSIQWVPGAVSLGVKWPGPEADHGVVLN